jgi:hypothetical protein
MKTKICIRDNESSTEIELDKNITIKMKHGGCPIADLLQGLDDSRSVDLIAHRILHRWLPLIEDPVTVNPIVEVTRGNEKAMATI